MLLTPLTLVQYFGLLDLFEQFSIALFLSHYLYMRLHGFTSPACYLSTFTWSGGPLVLSDTALPIESVVYIPWLLFLFRLKELVDDSRSPFSSPLGAEGN